MIIAAVVVAVVLAAVVVGVVVALKARRGEEEVHEGSLARTAREGRELGPTEAPAEPKPVSAAPQEPAESVAAAPAVEEAPAVENTPAGAAVAKEPAEGPEPELKPVAEAELVAEAEPEPDSVEDAESVAETEPASEAAVPPVVIDLDAEEPLAEIVVDLIDSADPDVAEVMARLIDASDPELVAQLIDDEQLEIAEVVARLLDGADAAVTAQVAELADEPERREVIEVLGLVESRFGGAPTASQLPPEVAAKLEELDIEADIDLTSRPAQMGQFGRLDNADQVRVIIRVLCGLVGRDDLPRSTLTPTEPRSHAEERRWPLSRARWPLPPPEIEELAERNPLPTRRSSSKAS